MQKIKVVSYFSGGGIGLAALPRDIFEFAGAVEYEPKLARLYALNYGDKHLYINRVQDIYPTMDFQDVRDGECDIFQASPVCKNFSKAKVAAEEGAEEFSQAEAIAVFIAYMMPKYVVVENVRKYATSASFALILKTLADRGYHSEYKVVNAADYGIPQTRERLILVATRSDIPDYIWPVETHHKGYTEITYPKGASQGRLTRTWNGWYDAIEDLIPAMPTAEFAPWQLARINRSEFAKFPFIVPGDNTSNNTMRMVDEPFVTVRARSIGQCPARAFIMDSQNDNPPRGADQPHYAITATVHRGYSRAWLPDTGRVVQMIPRALARFQSVPDTYKLTGKDAVDSVAIGNGIPSELLKIFVQNMAALEVPWPQKEAA